MDTQGIVREFLASRRARITPEQAGLPSFGGVRRVAGLRRAEVAMLAGVSPDYYTTQAWSPIGGITFYPGEERRTVLDDDTIRGIAATHDRSAAQVMLRWHIQQGRSVIPKSTNPARIAQNIDVFGFELDPSELAAIDGLDRGVRGGPDPDEVDPSTWDLTIPE